MKKIAYKRHNYSTTAIIEAWRVAKAEKGYAAVLARKFKLPERIIYNVVHNYRVANRANNQIQKTNKQNKLLDKSSHVTVIFAGANFDAPYIYSVFSQ